MTEPNKPVSNFSILVLTKDEQVNIAACLDSMSFCDDIIVLDSYSTDDTVKIAEQYPNVRVFQRKFDTWSRHSNWALTSIKYKYPWVYYSDADERITTELRDEITGIAQDPSQPHNAYRLRYKNMFMGRWIRRGGIYPVWIIRLYRPDKIHYEDRQVNAHPVVDGTIGDLKEHFIHYSFSKGLAAWFKKHNSYSELESHEATKIIQGSVFKQIRQVFDKDPATKRRAIKNLSFYLPGRAIVRFLYMYLIRGGMLDGIAGLRYALMISMYEYWIALKITEHGSGWADKSRLLADRLLEEGNTKR